MRSLVLVHATGAAVTAAIVSTAARTLAGPSAHLVYVRGPGAGECPGEPAVRAAVSARLGYDPFFAWAHDTVFAEIRRVDDGYVVELKLVDDRNMLRGAREISVSGSDCTAAIDAMALTVSLTLAPSTVSIPAPAAGAPASPWPDGGPSTEGVADAAPHPTSGDNSPAIPETGEPPLRSRSESVNGRLGLGAIGSLGAAPAPAIGGTLFGGVAWRALSVDLELRADVPSSGVGEVTPVRLRSWLTVGSLVPCVQVGWPFACFVLSGGSLAATSVDIAAPHQDRAPWWAGGVRGGASVPLTARFSLRAYAEALATFTRDTLTIDGNVVYQFASWSGGLGVDAAWRFP
jgi:hypothetical protein